MEKNHKDAPGMLILSVRQRSEGFGDGWRIPGAPAPIAECGKRKEMKKPRPGLNVTLGRHGDAKQDELADVDTEKNGASTHR